MKEKLMNLKITKQGKIVLSVVIAIFMLIFIITILYSNKFYPNTTVGGIDVSGMTLTEAREAVETDLKNHVLVIKGRNNAKYELKGKDIDLSAKYEDLVAFKKNVEKQQKEELIGGFYMLSDEDKKDVVAHIDEYSLDDIEAKLSVICVRKKVNFDLDDTSKNENKTEEENPVTTFNLDNAGDSVPAWIKAIQNHK